MRSDIGSAFSAANSYEVFHMKQYTAPHKRRVLVMEIKGYLEKALEQVRQEMERIDEEDL